MTKYWVKDAFTQYFVKIKQLAGGDANKLIVRRRHAHAVLPNLLGITVRTDLRMVFEKYFEAGDSIDDFKSECYGAVPVGIIKLTISKQEGDEPIVFQADRKTVRWIIDHLTALDKQIDAAERYFKLKEVD